jgi:hypothetical protein
VGDLQGLEAQLKGHFRSTNVVYAMLVEGAADSFTQNDTLAQAHKPYAIGLDR